MKNLTKLVLIFVLFVSKSHLYGIWDCLRRNKVEVISNTIIVDGEEISVEEITTNRRCFNHYLGKLTNSSIKTGDTKNLGKLLKWAKKLNNEDLDECVRRVLSKIEVIQGWNRRALANRRLLTNKTVEKKVNNQISKSRLFQFIKRSLRRRKKPKCSVPEHKPLLAPESNKVIDKDLDKVEETLRLLKNYFEYAD